MECTLDCCSNDVPSWYSQARAMPDSFEEWLRTLSSRVYLLQLVPLGRWRLTFSVHRTNLVDYWSIQHACYSKDHPAEPVWLRRFRVCPPAIHEPWDGLMQFPLQQTSEQAAIPVKHVRFVFGIFSRYVLIVIAGSLPKWVRISPTETPCLFRPSYSGP